MQYERSGCIVVPEQIDSSTEESIYSVAIFIAIYCQGHWTAQGSRVDRKREWGRLRKTKGGDQTEYKNINNDNDKNNAVSNDNNNDNTKDNHQFKQHSNDIQSHAV